MKRISRKHLYIAMVNLMAQRSTCDRAHIGCVIVKDGRIIATGYNGSPSGTPHCTDAGCIMGEDGGCIRTVHAEAGAISFAAKHGIALDGTIMFVSQTPCLNCAKLIINAGIQEVFFLEDYRKIEGAQLLIESGIAVLPVEYFGGYPNED